MSYFSLFPTALGDCGIAWRGETVVATCLPGKNAAATSHRLAARSGATKGEPPPAIERAIAGIAALLDGDKTDLAFIACDFDGIEPFAAQVYALTRAIPAGTTATYGAIALRLGDKRLARRVGQALGRNPFPIVVPCHRVIGADDKLTGFSANGGTATKLKMLAIEGARIGEAPGLFGDLPAAIKPRA
ncbi:MAG: methylated-DNA--[protein]-cysteine S-methyltransferase [Tagaea sp.]|nr:methylated-DNA--[protein]-cysteine S-methyltransferase [Tagaea sp.]